MLLITESHCLEENRLHYLTLQREARAAQTHFGRPFTNDHRLLLDNCLCPGANTLKPSKLMGKK